MLALALCLGTPAAAVQDYASARYRVISPPDCVDATNIIAEFAPAPANATYLRVQHVGDPGTAELLEEVANPVTWDVGAYSGLSLPSAARLQFQRGYRDAGPPGAASAFQLACNAAGFHLDTRTFSHASPLTLEGPSVSVARDLVPPATVFRNWTSALTLEAQVGVPWVRNEPAPVVEGTAQVSFFYYARDTITGALFAHVIVLFDNRRQGTDGAGVESISADAYTAFVVSPLAPVAGGVTTQYVSAAPSSETMHFVVPWTGRRLFRVHVAYEQFRSMLVRLAHESLPGISVRPEDWRVTLFGVLGEVFPGTGTAHEVALGASVTDLALSEAYDDVAAVDVIEFHHGGLDHYFLASRREDLEALDSGRFTGWARTGRSFRAYPGFVEGAAPVCRFYLPPAAGDSHFFSASATECDEVARRFPQFVLEDAQVMYVMLPDPATGACPAPSVPVYRLWNARPDTNHRYTADRDVKREMLGAGWIAEGYGEDAVAMCAPAR
jgi:hypothetical protein